MGRANWLILTALAASLSAGGALAIEQDIEPLPEVEAEAAAPAAESTLLGLPADVAFGIAMTTDYVSRGITQTGNDLAVQGYIEPTIGMAYVNIWSSNVDFGGEGFRGAEIDTAIGIRPEFGPLSLDLGYVHYFYSPEDISPDYGEIFAKADYNFQDMVTFGARVFFAPDFNQSGNTATFVAGGLARSLAARFLGLRRRGLSVLRGPERIRATGLDRWRLLRLEGGHIRSALLGYRPRRRRMRGPKRIFQRLRRTHCRYDLAQHRLVGAEAKRVLISRYQVDRRSGFLLRRSRRPAKGMDRCRRSFRPPSRSCSC